MLRLVHSCEENCSHTARHELKFVDLLCEHKGMFGNNWEAKDQWHTTVDFNLPVMVDYNFKGNIRAFGNSRVFPYAIFSLLNTAKITTYISNNGKSRFTLGLNTAKHTHYIKKNFK